MKSASRSLALWGGGGAAVVLAGWIVLLARSEGRNAALEQAGRLHERYVKLYHPDQPAGLPVARATQDIAAAAKLQAEERSSAERILAPPLAAAYLVEGVGDATAQVTADYASLRQQANKQSVSLPAGLPFEGGLEADAKLRARQLATLALIRQALHTCMVAGVVRIGNVSPGRPYASPNAAYAVFPCDIEVEADWQALSNLLAAFARPDGRGLGLAGLNISDPGSDRPKRARFTALLTTPNRTAWGLEAAAAAPAAAPGASTPEAPRPGGRRLSGGSL